MSYQQLNKQERVKVRINGQDVSELDYSAMHPHILYAWEGLQCPNDFYERTALELGIPYNASTKPAVKGVTLMSINASDEPTLEKAIKNESRKERKSNKTRANEGRQSHLVLEDELTKLSIDFRAVVSAFVTAHPIVANKYLYTNIPNKLMLKESEIMTSVLLELMKRNIYAIPIHDSVLFPKQYAPDVKQVMLDCYLKNTGFAIGVK